MLKVTLATDPTQPSPPLFFIPICEGMNVRGSEYVCGSGSAGAISLTISRRGQGGSKRRNSNLLRARSATTRHETPTRPYPPPTTTCRQALERVHMGGFHIAFTRRMIFPPTVRTPQRGKIVAWNNQRVEFHCGYARNNDMAHSHAPRRCHPPPSTPLPLTCTTC